MTTQEIEVILKNNGIRVTASRILIMKAMLSFENTFDLIELETVLETVDRSTIFRTIQLFEDKHLLHSIQDGTDKLKHCMCFNSQADFQVHHHAHFHCIRCGVTICLDESLIEFPKIPPHYAVQSANVLLTGLCAKCSKK